MIGIEAAAKSDPDGYTVLIAADAVASNPHVYKVELRSAEGLDRRSSSSRASPIVLAVHPSLGVSTLGELVALREAAAGPALRDRQRRTARRSTWSTQWFAQLAGIELEQVPYRGGGQAINDLIAGHVQARHARLDAAHAALQGRQALALLAQTTAARSQSLPDVPTFQEAGVKGLVLDQWLGVFVPAGTPQPIVARLNAEIGKALADPAIRANLVNSAQDPIGGTAEAFGRLVRDDFEKYRRLVRELQIKTN